MWFLKKFKIELPYYPVIPLTDLYPTTTTTTKHIARKDICTLMFMATLFAITKIWKEPKYT